MRITKLIINNFRAFKHTEIAFDDFNCIIGKNDTGKSTILAAMEWFFDQNRELNEEDFAAAGFEWSEYEHPSYYDEITGETFQGETVKDIIYDKFCISVDVYFSDANLPKRTEEADFIFSKDYMSKDGDICIRKYMRHPFEYLNLPYKGKLMGYCIKKRYFENVGKAFSDCTVEELETAYNEIGKSADELCKVLHQLEEKRSNKNRGIGLVAINSKICDEKVKIKEQICSELYNHYNSVGEKTCDEQWMSFDDIDSIEFHFGITLPTFILYTSKTPINDYLNLLFTPYNANGVYKSIEKTKAHTAKKLSKHLNLDSTKEHLFIKENEKIDLFTPNSLIFKQNDLPLSIPLKNRGEGLQLKIKNAVFRLLTENQQGQQQTVFAFEEPESHLHPSAQIEMYETIKSLSEKPNYQVIITTHSPFIVKELAQNNNLPVVVKREGLSQDSRISKLDESVLPYVSMNEINYIAYEEPSIEYHIELFGYIQQKINGNPDKVDKWLFDNKCAERIYVFYKISKTGRLIPDNKGDYRHEQRTLPYCVRNQVDHPHDNNKQYENKCKIKESIEILRKAIIKNINTKC